MKMDREVRSAISNIVDELISECETIVRDLVEAKGEKFSGNLIEYLDTKSDKYIGKDGNYPIFCMENAWIKAIDILTNSEMVK